MNREILDCSGAVGEGIVYANMNIYGAMMSRIRVVKNCEVQCMDEEKEYAESIDFELLKEEINKDEEKWKYNKNRHFIWKAKYRKSI